MSVNSFDNYPMSWKPSITSQAKPLYLAIVQKLEQDIKDGILQPHTKLPPQRELADYLDVNLSTITRAFKLCTLNGLLYGIVGKGTFVMPYPTLKKLAVDSSFIDMEHLETFPQFNLYIKKALSSIVDSPFFSSSMAYENKDSLEIHHIAAASYLNYFSISAQHNQLILCPGSQNAISTVLLALFQAGDKIAVDEYTYHNFKILASHLNIQLIPISMDEQGMVPEDLEKNCSLKSIKGIYLMPVCHNPTAITIPASRKEELIGIIKRYNLWIIEDASNFFLSDTSVSLSFYERLPEQTILIMGTSKSLCSGIRIALVLYPASISTLIKNSFVSLNLKTSSLDAEIFTNLITTGVFPEIIDEKKKLLQARNSLFLHYFQFQSSYESPLSFYRWVKLPDKESINEFIQKCYNHKILISSPEQFAAGINVPRSIRISLSAPKTDNLLQNGLSEIKNLIIS